MLGLEPFSSKPQTPELSEDKVFSDKLRPWSLSAIISNARGNLRLILGGTAVVAAVFGAGFTIGYSQRKEADELNNSIANNTPSAAPSITEKAISSSTNTPNTVVTASPSFSIVSSAQPATATATASVTTQPTMKGKLSETPNAPKHQQPIQSSDDPKQIAAQMVNIGNRIQFQDDCRGIKPSSQKEYSTYKKLKAQFYSTAGFSSRPPSLNCRRSDGQLVQF